MIDPLSEELIPFAEASKLFPPRRRGQRPSLSCIYRWTANGCKGVVLESVQAAGTRCTSREAVGRFVEALTHRHRPHATTAAPNVKAVAKAQEYLDREGV